MTDTLLAQTYQRTRERVHKDLLGCDELTSREAFIVALFAKGRTMKDIASYYSLSVATIQAHFKNIYSKLGIHDQTQLVRWYNGKYFNTQLK